MPQRLLIVLSLVLAPLVLFACHLTNKTEALSVHGKVELVDGSPVLNATVALGNDELTVETNADGAFTLPLQGKVGDAVALSARGPGYARVSRPYSIQANQTAAVTLVVRPADTLADIVLPTGTQMPLEVVATTAQGKATLRISPDNLVLPSGAVATGGAKLKFTYWHPDGERAHIPALLRAKQKDGTIRPLVTYGMVDIEATQGGEVLQLAPGTSLTLTMPAGQAQQASLSATPALLPSLYSVNDKTGMWEFEGDATDGRVAYQAQTQTLVATLPHLSAWNLDLGLSPDRGGCVQGKLYDACDHSKALGANDVSIYLMDIEQVARFQSTTNNSGAFCFDIPFSIYKGAGDTSSASTHYLIAGKTPDATAQCNPAPAACLQCTPLNSFPGYEHYCSECRYGFEAADNTGGVPATHYTDGCTPPTPVVNIKACHFCPGTSMPALCDNPYSQDKTAVSGGCEDIGKVYVPGPGCDCSGNKCSGSGACTKPSNVGDPCDDVNPCCPNKALGQSLRCSDNLCVPAD